MKRGCRFAFGIALSLVCRPVRAGILSQSELEASKSQSGICFESDGSNSCGNGKYAISLSPARFEAGYREERNRAQQAARSFTDAVRKSETELWDLAVRDARRHPSIAQASRDWMSCPDLKKLYDDYIRDPDPVAFVLGLAQSKNFAALAGRYAGDPAVRSLVTAWIRQAPEELASATLGLIREDCSLKSVVADTAQALGLPRSLSGLDRE